MAKLNLFSLAIKIKIMPKDKVCKGTGKAKGHGCSTILPYTENNGIRSYKAKYGLGFDCRCYNTWLATSKEGAEILKRAQLSAKKKISTEKKKAWTKQKREFNTSNAMRLADTYFSRYIRLKYSFDNNGIRCCTCFTSGNIIPIKEIDNGHYQKREHKATRFHEDNCRPQSKTDNGDVKHNGKQSEFRDNLVREIGEDRVLEVERLAKTSIKADSFFYRAIATKYRLEVNRIQKELGVKYW